jgi:hypothetical protein
MYFPVGDSARMQCRSRRLSVKLFEMRNRPIALSTGGTPDSPSTPD